VTSSTVPKVSLGVSNKSKYFVQFTRIASGKVIGRDMIGPKGTTDGAASEFTINDLLAKTNEAAPSAPSVVFQLEAMAKEDSPAIRFAVMVIRTEWLGSIQQIDLAMDDHGATIRCGARTLQQDWLKN
jgi:hypothetical protein